jgi:hypothetical protein
VSFSKSPFRNRVYERRFDWDLARAMYREGLTIAEIARRLYVDRRGVARVVHLPESRVRKATEEEIALAFQYRDRTPCPRCGRPKVAKAELCASCRQETRLLPMTLRKVPGTPGSNGRSSSRMELRDVGPNRIVEVDGSWGVLTRSPVPPPYGYRFVDFWDEPAAFVHERTRVAVAPSSEVVIGGVPQETEEIHE